MQKYDNIFVSPVVPFYGPKMTPLMKDGEMETLFSLELACRWATTAEWYIH